MKPAAFFDLDGTLLTVNSTSLWIRREFRLGRITYLQYLQGLGFLLAYKFGAVDMERVMLKALRIISGVPEDTIRNRIRVWFDKDVIQHSASGARPVIHKHRELGHRLVLLTSASFYEAEIACEHFGFEHFISSRYEVKNGLFTGDLIRPICYGHGKVHLAEAYAAKNGVDLSVSFFYTDSYTDLPMLQRAGYPYTVHPDPRLKLKAKRKGWPILNWR